MPNFKISDLAPGVLADANVFEQDTGAPPSQKITAAQLKAYVLPSEASGFDDFATEFFDGYSVGAISAFTGGAGWTANGVGSGASIISATMADGRTQNRLALNNGSYGRKMPWGAFWNRIKLVLAVRINSGVTFANTNGFIGVCSGTAQMVDSATCLNFTGIRWGDGTGTSTFTAGTKINFFDVPTFRALTKRAAVITDKGGLSSGHSLSADGGYLSFICMEISRPVFANDASSINYSVAEASCNTTTVQFSHTKDQARGICQGDVTSSLANAGSDVAIIGASGVTATPFAFDQSTGVLDTINLYWPQAFNLEIAALALRKVA